MNRADRATIARALMEADEQGVTLPSLERYRRLLEPVEAPTRPQKPRSKPRRSDVPSLYRQTVHARSRGRCEAETPDCTYDAVLLHHVAGRRGPDPHRPSNLLHLCNGCHLYIHAHPERSYAEGWMAKRLGGAS